MLYLDERRVSHAALICDCSKPHPIPLVRTVNPMRSLRKKCGCECSGTRAVKHQATDPPVIATEEDLRAIRDQLRSIEQKLEAIFGQAYNRSPESLEARCEAADIIEAHFEGIIDQWLGAEAHIFDWDPADSAKLEGVRSNCWNAMVRFVSHLRDPDNLETYIYLRRH